MAISQADFRVMFERNERNKRLAKLNPDRSLDCVGMSPAFIDKPVFPTGMTQVKPSKYRNIKVEYEGMKFDSKHELECWKNLKLRERAGEIENLERQVKFPMVVNGKKVGRFTADFVWRENHQTFVADAKSPPTRKETAYRLRKKLWEAIYSPLVIREL